MAELIFKIKITFWGWKPLKNKNIESNQKFTDSYMKKCVYLRDRFSKVKE